MRKKYLSALLFGALLFASAGTFTSCKDYDDDINNLQEQINTVVSDLASLKSQIDNLGTGVSSVTFDEATGVLTVVDGAGTHTYTIKTAAGEVADVKITIEGQELKVNGETVGKVGDTVTVVDGELTVNGEGTGIKVGEYTILDNQDAGTVTITLPDADGKLQTVVLAKASSSLTSMVIVSENPIFNSGYTANGHTEIMWGTAALNKSEWNITRNQLLVGHINTIEVQVLPANYELDKAQLTLKNSLGEEAPVTVIPTPNDKLLKPAATRTSSKNGSWNISIEMDETVTADNIAKVFDNKKNENLAYALCVNGNPVTPYDITIDINEAKQTGAPGAEEISTLKYIDSEGYYVDLKQGGKLPLNAETDLKLEIGKGYTAYITRSYISFEGKNETIAKANGISADGMTITTTNASAGVTLKATVHILDVTGNDYEKTIDLTVENSEAASTVVDYTYKVMPVEIKSSSSSADLTPITISLKDAFAGIDASLLAQIKNPDQVQIVEEKDQTGFILATSNGTVAANGPALNNYFFKEGDKAWEFGKDAFTDVDHIALKFGNGSNNTFKIAKDAVKGDYALYFIAKDKDLKNELFRIKMNVKVALPEFTDLFKENSAYWTDGKFNARITPSGTVNGAFDAKAVLTLSSAFSAIEGTNAVTSRIAYVFSEDDCKYFSDLEKPTNGSSDPEDKNAVVTTEGIATLKKSEVYKEGYEELKVNKLTGITAYTSVLAGLQNGKFEADADVVKEAFTVTHAPYDAVITPALNGVSLVYYVNGVAQSLQNEIQLTGEGIFTPLTFKDNIPSDGFGFVLNDNFISAKYTTSGADHSKELGGYGLDTYGIWTMQSEITDAKRVLISTSATNGASVDFTTIGKDVQGYKETSLATGNSSDVTFTLKDATGFIYKSTVTVKR